MPLNRSPLFRRLESRLAKCRSEEEEDNDEQERDALDARDAQGEEEAPKQMPQDESLGGTGSCLFKNDVDDATHCHAHCHDEYLAEELAAKFQVGDSVAARYRDGSWHGAEVRGFDHSHATGVLRWIISWEDGDPTDCIKSEKQLRSCAVPCSDASGTGVPDRDHLHLEDRDDLHQAIVGCCTDAEAEVDGRANKEPSDTDCEADAARAVNSESGGGVEAECRGQDEEEEHEDMEEAERSMEHVRWLAIRKKAAARRKIYEAERDAEIAGIRAQRDQRVRAATAAAVAALDFETALQVTNCRAVLPCCSD
jgi:hypothetical protein